jgi:hypothetical protein
MKIFRIKIFKANSKYNLKYQMIQSEPNLEQLQMNSVSGQVYLIKPLNSSILTNYDRYDEF